MDASAVHSDQQTDGKDSPLKWIYLFNPKHTTTWYGSKGYLPNSRECEGINENISKLKTLKLSEIVTEIIKSQKASANATSKEPPSQKKFKILALKYLKENDEITVTDFFHRLWE